MNQRTIISQWQCHTDSAETIVVLPDGCRDLLVRVDAEQRTSLLLTGLDHSSYQVAAQAGERFYGIRLAAGCGVTGSVAFTSRIRTLQQKLQQLVEQPLELQQTLLEWQQASLLPADNLMNEFIHSIREGAALAGISERTLRRRVTAASGASPSFWYQLYRARAAASSLCRGEFTGDSELAYHHGYADQAHLCREMRRWFAQTPGGLRRESLRYTPLLQVADAFSGSTA